MLIWTSKNYTKYNYNQRVHLFLIASFFTNQAQTKAQEVP